MLTEGSSGSSQNQRRVLPFSSTIAHAGAGPVADAQRCRTVDGSALCNPGTRQLCLRRAKKPVARRTGVAALKEVGDESHKLVHGEIAIPVEIEPGEAIQSHLFVNPPTTEPLAVLLG